MTPMISVVMPVYNEERFIRQTLDQLLRQEYPGDRFEVLVADGMSSDRTRDIVKDVMEEHQNVRLLDNPKRKSSSGRNVGFTEGRGDFYLVIDGHCHIPDDQLLRNVSKAFSDNDVDCLGRPQPLDPPHLSPFQQKVASARASKIGHGSDSLIYSDFEGFCTPDSNGAAYSKRVFETVGYVDESFDACEDVEFNHRVGQAGFKAFTSPSLMVKYYPRDSLAGLFKQMMRYGAGRYRLYKKHPETLGILTLVPALFVIYVFLTLLCLLLSLVGIIPAGGAAVFTVALLCYFVLVGAMSMRLFEETGIDTVLSLVAIFFTIHTGLGWGFLSQAIRRAWSELGQNS